MAAKPKGSAGPGKVASRPPEAAEPGIPPAASTGIMPDAAPGGLPDAVPDPAPAAMHKMENDITATDVVPPRAVPDPPGLDEAMQEGSGQGGVPEAQGSAEAPSGASARPSPAASQKSSPKDALIEALMELAGERVWEDITLSDIATRANLSLADFRDAFPSKGAVLAGFSRKIDRIVLDGTTDDLAGEPAKERLFDVLMRRLDALAPYKLGLESVTEWLGRAPLAAAAVNRLEVNSMRFMLEAAGIDTEGPVGAVKLQGLVIAWGRVIRVWLRDDDPALSKTMNALDKELTRGVRIVGRADDINRLVSPLIALTKAMFERRPDYPRETSRPAEEPTSF